jgi:hypothetical protein
MPNANEKARKKDSVRLVWDTKRRRPPNPKDIELQTAEVVIPNPKPAGELPLSFRNGLIGEEEIDKQKMNRIIYYVPPRRPSHEKYFASIQIPL